MQGLVKYWPICEFVLLDMAYYKYVLCHVIAVEMILKASETT